jgi:hypothetical protein
MYDPLKDDLIRALERAHLAWWLAELFDAVIRIVSSLV